MRRVSNSRAFNFPVSVVSFMIAESAAVVLDPGDLDEQETRTRLMEERLRREHISRSTPPGAADPLDATVRSMVTPPAAQSAVAVRG
jgi:hypothetical protein